MGFKNLSNSDYHFTIKEAANKYEGDINCPEESTEKYQTFPVPIIKEFKRTDENTEEII